MIHDCILQMLTNYFKEWIKNKHIQIFSVNYHTGSIILSILFFFFTEVGSCKKQQKNLWCISWEGLRTKPKARGPKDPIYWKLHWFTAYQTFRGCASSHPRTPGCPSCQQSVGLTHVQLPTSPLCIILFFLTNLGFIEVNATLTILRVPYSRERHGVGSFPSISCLFGENKHK